MDGPIFAALIILIIFSSMVLRRYLSYRSRIEELKIHQQNTYTGDIKIEINALKNRVAALEKIVTQKGYQLHDEIDSL